MSEELRDLGNAEGGLALLRRIADNDFPFLSGLVERGEAMFGEPWSAAFEETLARTLPTEAELSPAVRGYALFVMDLLRRQRLFERTGEYEPKSHAEAAAEVYLADTYMTEQYLPGLLLSHFLWPHHYRQQRFFEEAFCAPMRLAGGVRFAEVGVGTGLYSRRLLQEVAGCRGIGYDISPASAAFAAAHIGAFQLEDRYTTSASDVMVDTPEPVDWLVCVEVLEHLEDPPAFLAGLRGMLREGGRAFITTALNAAHVDHIYLYRSSDEVLRQIEAAGFELEQAFQGTAHPPREKGVPVPSVVAYVVG